jgi:hypothetical protein
MAITPTYSWPTPDDTDLVKDGAEAIRDLALAIESTVSALGSKRIARFTASGTWTVPTGVTYAIAHILGGGGGVGAAATAGAGGASSVAFAGGTVSSNGGSKGLGVNNTTSAINGEAGQANSGRGANRAGSGNVGTTELGSEKGTDAQWVTAGDSVTPAASITITVGAGGSAGTRGAAGGSGYVFIEYYE